MNDGETESLLFEADGLCSLIYYRERSHLTAQTQEDLKQLCEKLRVATKEIERGRHV